MDSDQFPSILIDKSNHLPGAPSEAPSGNCYGIVSSHALLPSLPPQDILLTLHNRDFDSLDGRHTIPRAFVAK